MFYFLLLQGLHELFIDGTPIQSSFSIPIWHFGNKLASLNDKMRSNLRNKYSQVKVIIIYEISTVSNAMLFYLWLVEIFDCTSNISFASIIITVVGDFLQLKQGLFIRNAKMIGKTLLRFGNFPKKQS